MMRAPGHEFRGLRLLGKDAGAGANWLMGDWECRLCLLNSVCSGIIVGGKPTTKLRMPTIALTESYIDIVT
jgi:hypothetical protein